MYLSWVLERLLLSREGSQKGDWERKGGGGRPEQCDPILKALMSVTFCQI